jgi:mannose-1-phosphate guanylyltransferase/mannose-1-phosphate guanylyltransferase/mannose-6-phosphate isomerase
MISDEPAPVIPVVLSGGSGTRLWPLSRERSPKQFLPLLSGLSLFQETVCRARSATPEPPVVVCNVEHRAFVEEQLGQLGVIPAAIVCEPVARSTAPAVAAAALAVATDRPDALLLVLPSDHLVGDVPQFVEDVAAAAPAASAGYLVTFGITPTGPETGFGYVHQGPAVSGIGRVWAADEFVEKPDADRAQSFVEQGKWHWNSGMFLLSRDVLLTELSTYEPTAVRAAERAVELAEWDGRAVLLDAASFAAAPSISLDYAVMERTEQAAVLPSTLPWSDVGAWSSLWEESDQDSDGNVMVGDVLSEASSDCYLRSEGPLVAAVGLEGITVVVTDDAVLVADRAHSQQVREVVTRLRADGRTEAESASLVRRPWGTYQSVDVGHQHQVKRIVVEPGRRLSLQRHRHRAEHWVVVQGTASIVRGDDSYLLHENESVFIPVGCAHRLENPGNTPLHLVEVQVGDYLGEDDIERLADDYGRC